MGKGDPKGGRPREEVDIDKLRNMVRIQCTAEECASILEVSVDTIDRRLKEAGYAGFADFFKKHQDEGKASLRRAQWKAATENHNPTMLVWLGKQMLGQTDKVENTVKGDKDNPVAVQVDYTQLSTTTLKELEGVLAKDDPSTDN